METLFKAPHLIMQIMDLLEYADLMNLAFTCKSIYLIFIESKDDDEVAVKRRRYLWLTPSVKMKDSWTRVYDDELYFPTTSAKVSNELNIFAVMLLIIWQIFRTCLQCSKCQIMEILWYLWPIAL